MIATLAIAAPVVATLAGLTYATVSPACSFWGPVISRRPRELPGQRGTDGAGRIAITFDDGPTPGPSERILDALRDAGVVATFFVIGANCCRHPQLLRRMHDEGHQVGNHSFDHPHFGVTRRWRYWEREIRETDAAIEEVIGLRPAVFRPPMGIKTWHTARAARQCGHQVVTWSRRAVDGLPTTSQKILGRFQRATDGDILLLHDGVEPHALHADRSATIDAIVPLLDLLKARGLTPVRLDALTGLPAYHHRATATARQG